MNSRHLFLGLVCTLMLGACGLYKFGVGEVKDESAYTGAVVLDDGITMLFAYSERRVKREPIGLGWEKRTIYLRDTKYLCARNLETGKTRILLELRNDRRGHPFKDIVLGEPEGGQVLVTSAVFGNGDPGRRGRRFIFDRIDYQIDPTGSLRDLARVGARPSQTQALVASDGTLLIEKAVGLPESDAQVGVIMNPEERPDHLVLKNRQADGSYAATLLKPHLDILR